MPSPATRQLLKRLGILGAVAVALISVGAWLMLRTFNPMVGVLFLYPTIGVLMFAAALLLVHLLRTASPIIRVRCRGCQALNVESANACAACGSGI